MDVKYIETIRRAIGKRKIAVLTDIFQNCKGTPPGVEVASYRRDHPESINILDELVNTHHFLKLRGNRDGYQLTVYALPLIDDSRAMMLHGMMEVVYAELQRIYRAHLSNMVPLREITDRIAGDPRDVREALFYITDSGNVSAGLSIDFPYGDDPKIGISESVLRIPDFRSVLAQFCERNFPSPESHVIAWPKDRSKEKSEKDSRHPFSTERAIESAQQDLLGRASFALAVADAIRGWPGDDSLVIALTGEWGSGKSSVKNMAVEALKNEAGNTPQIVEFNPWQWAGQQKLHAAFFDELSIAIGRTAPEKGSQRKAAQWRHYGHALGVGSTLFSGVHRLMSWLILLLVGLGVLSNLIDSLWLGRVALILIAVIALTNVSKWGSKLSLQIAKLYETYSGATEKTLSELKNELKRDLKGLERLVLIVCDDIDRLDANQTKLLFQLIKANADFPNMVYLLAFQRDVIESHLSTDRILGRDYLEKIVQVIFNIPTIERSRLEHVLFSKLDEILESDQQITKRFDQAYWGNLYYGGLHHYFQTLRDVYRFLSTFAFQVSLLKGKHAFEVNPVDLIALEVLRVFEPSLYTEIYASKQLLTGQSRVAHEDREETRKAVQTLIDLAPEKNRDAAKQILMDLFPNLASVFDRLAHGAERYDEWYQDLRVCHKDVFDRYFLLAISNRDLSQSELDELISLSNERDKLVSKFEELRKRNLLDVAFDRLDIYKQKIPIENAVSFVSAIFDVGDTLRRDHVLRTELDPHTHAWRIVSWYLKQESNSERRADILLKAADQSDGLTILISLLFLEEEKRGKSSPNPEGFLVPDKQLSQLKERCIAKIRNSAVSKDGKLAKNPQLSTLLYRWNAWGDSNEVRSWVAELIKNPDGLLNFLVSFTAMSTSQQFGSRVARIKWRINLTEIEKFVSVAELTNEVSKIDLSALTEEQKRAVDAFKRAKTRRDAGKRDNDFFDLDDE